MDEKICCSKSMQEMTNSKGKYYMCKTCKNVRLENENVQNKIAKCRKCNSKVNKLKNRIGW